MKSLQLTPFRILGLSGPQEANMKPKRGKASKSNTKQCKASKSNAKQAKAMQSEQKQCKVSKSEAMRIQETK